MVNRNGAFDSRISSRAGSSLVTCPQRRAAAASIRKTRNGNRPIEPEVVPMQEANIRSRSRNNMVFERKDVYTVDKPTCEVA